MEIIVAKNSGLCYGVRRALDIANETRQKKAGKFSNTYFIETAAQIKPEMLKGAKRIGLSGGASTLPKAIQEAVAKTKTSFKNQFHREKTVQCQR